MLESMSYYELLHWLWLEQIDPVGPKRADLRHAIVGARLHNDWVSKDKDAKKPKDLMAGEWYRQAYETSAKKRGVMPEFDGPKFWANFKAVVHVKE